jgi:hypothetical protein
MSKLLRRIVLFIWGVFLLPIIGQLPISWLGSMGLYTSPDAFSAMNVVLALGQNYWVQMIAVGLTTLNLGIWLDWIARKFDNDESQELRGLGWEFQLLANQASRAQNNFPSQWPQNVHSLQPNLLSTFLSAQNLGLWVPGQEIFHQSNPALLINYLKGVGNLLHNGHLREAKEMALRAKQMSETGGQLN